MEITVFVPTRGRWGESRQITLRELSTKSDIVPYLVCPHGEGYRHTEYHSSHSVLETPEGLEGIGPTRQWIIENSPTQGVVMIDDDMYFQRRRDGVGTLYVPDDLNPLFHWIRMSLEKYAHGGVSARQGNNHIAESERVNGRMNNFLFYDRDIYMEEGCRFDAIPVMEDFYVTLDLLTMGYENVVSYEWVWNQRRSGYAGGCSLYRTKDMQGSAARRLKEKFPGFVKVVTKYKEGHSVFSGIHTDVQIQWRKAFDTKPPRSWVKKHINADAAKTGRTSVNDASKE